MRLSEERCYGVMLCSSERAPLGRGSMTMGAICHGSDDRAEGVIPTGVLGSVSDPGVLRFLVDDFAGSLGKSHSFLSRFASL